MTRSLVCLLLLHGAAAASPRNVISLQATSLSSGGLGAQYERLVLPRRLSLAAGLAARVREASGDYRGRGVAAALEARWWFTHRASFAGPFLAARASVAEDWLEDAADGRTVGRMVTLTGGLSAGWRWRIRRFEITPSIGGAWIVQIDPGQRLAPLGKRALSLGLTLGWMF